MEQRPKLLVVDDKPENLVAIETVLRDLEVEIIKVTSGTEALRATLHHKFALALLDIQMPEMDGYELAGILREDKQTANLPFIFISAVYTDNINIFKGYEKGAFSYITKPFPPEVLLKKVSFFLEKHRQEVELYKLNKLLAQKNNELENSVSELANALEREKEIHEMKSAFVSMVSHEFRTPLGTILSSASLAKKYILSDQQNNREKHLSRIKSSVEHLVNLLNDCLSLGKLEEGKVQIENETLNLKELLQDISTEVDGIKKENQEIQFKYKGEENVKLDRKILRNVMLNLFSNAIKYSDTHIELDAEVNDNRVTLIVKDKGIGIPEDQQKNIFGKFFRANNAGSIQGTGLGLNIVKHYVDLLGGTIDFVSKENQGTVFTVLLVQQ